MVLRGSPADEQPLGYLGVRESRCQERQDLRLSPAGLIPVSTLFCAAAIGTGSLGLVEALGVLVVGAGVSFGVSAPPQAAEEPVTAP